MQLNDLYSQLFQINTPAISYKNILFYAISHQNKVKLALFPRTVNRFSLKKRHPMDITIIKPGNYFNKKITQHLYVQIKNLLHLYQQITYIQI